MSPAAITAVCSGVAGIIKAVFSGIVALRARASAADAHARLDATPGAPKAAP